MRTLNIDETPQHFARNRQHGIAVTNTDKVRAYYATFDEWSRLDSPEGAREFARALEILTERLSPGSRVLDLGGGPGRYAIELAHRGHRVVLADLSRAQLEVARQRVAAAGVDLGGHPNPASEGRLKTGQS